MKKLFFWAMDIVAGVFLAVMLQKPVQGVVEATKAKCKAVYKRIKPQTLEQWVNNGYK